jgi:Protein of unknown function (DUF3108)
MKSMASALVALVAMLRPLTGGAADAALAPFVAEYDVRYGSMAVGTSRTELTRSAPEGRWVIESRSTASGFARMIAGGTLVQRSTFEASAEGLKPISYSFDDGTKRTGRDVQLEFDWGTKRVHGTAEDEPVDLAASEGLQDAASMQALVLARLRSGAEPGSIPMIEKDRIKVYRYTLLRRERLTTAVGELDTVVYRSAREGSDRETISWFAPELGYAVVQAEQRINGKRRGFQTLIRSYEPGS